MSLNRHNPKRDANELPIVHGLQEEGFWVIRLDKPVDLLVGRRGFPHFALLEVKMPGKQLTPDQVRFFQISEGAMRFVVHSPEEALRVCKTWIQDTKNLSLINLGST